MIGLLLLLLALGGGAIAYVGYLGLAGKLPRQRWAGIRTPFTLSSDEAWVATHRAAGPVMVLGGVAVAAIALAFAPFAVGGAVGDTLGIAVASICGSLAIGVALAGWFIGTRGAGADREPPRSVNK